MLYDLIKILMQDECCIPKAPIVMPSNNRGKVYYRAIAILLHAAYLQPD